MTKFKVAIVVGSIRRDSINLRLAKALAQLGRDKFDAQYVKIDDLPLYNADMEPDFPAPATRIKKDIETADALLFVTPEYNRAIPGGLKNAIDWASRPYGKNSFAGKPAAVCGASVGAIGSACAQQSIYPILACLNVTRINHPELFLHYKDGMIDADGNIASDDTRKFLQGFVDKFVAGVGRCSLTKAA